MKTQRDMIDAIKIRYVLEETVILVTALNEGTHKTYSIIYPIKPDSTTLASLSEFCVPYAGV